jgi:hypothetical protein
MLEALLVCINAGDVPSVADAAGESAATGNRGCSGEIDISKLAVRVQVTVIDARGIDANADDLARRIDTQRKADGGASAKERQAIGVRPIPG